MEAHVTTRQLPENDRPYEKLAALGAAALSDAELAAVLIRNGTRTENSVALAQRLLLRGGEGRGPSFLLDASVEELQRIPGIGRVKAVTLKAAVELGRRATRAAPTRAGERVRDPETLVDGVLDEMRFLEREEMWVVLLDVRGGLLRTLRFAGGGVAGTVVHPRDLFRDAVRCGASGVVLAHNHPSGDPEPSEDDLRTTARLREAGETLGIRLVDHIVVAVGGSVSLKRRGLV
jgi:DNA repair protein RadC